MSPRRTVRRGRLPAAVLAVMAHLAALFALGWRAPILVQKREDDLAPAVQVTLIRRAKPLRLAAPAPRAAPKPKPPPEPRSPSPTLLPPVLTQPAPASMPAAAQPGAAAEGEHLRSALRGLMGCRDPSAYRLNREEREDCDRRLSAAKPAPVGPQLSADELAQFNAGRTYDPILVRKPHNGCLPRIGDRKPPPSVPGRSGSSTTFGLGCAWSF